VCYVINAWQILGPAPIIRNHVLPSIPHGFLPKSLSARARDYPHDKEESKAEQGTGTSQWIVNMWALIWSSHKPTPDVLVFPNVMFECVSPSICGLPTWFIGETCHECAEIIYIAHKKTRSGNCCCFIFWCCSVLQCVARWANCSSWCTSLITVMKARRGKLCVFIKLSCPCCDPSLFGRSCYSLCISRLDCKSIIRSCWFRVWVDGNIDQDISLADSRQLFLNFGHSTWSLNLSVCFCMISKQGRLDIYWMFSKTWRGWQFTVKNMTWVWRVEKNM